MRPLKADMPTQKAPTRTPEIDERADRINHLLSIVSGLRRSPDAYVRNLGMLMQISLCDLERLNDIALLIANTGDDPCVSLWMRIDAILKQT